MAGGSFTNPVAPKGDTTKLIPFSPQQDSINQYLRFNSSAFRTKNGYDYIQKNRTSPQRSYKMRYRLNKTDAYKMESLLFNPELFYLPLWEQKQVYGKKIAVGDTYINNYTTLDTTDMIFWLFKEYFEYESGSWWVRDYLESDGYYLFDGTDDYLNNTHALTWGDAYTIAFSLKHPTGTILKGYPDFGGIYSFAYSYLDCYDSGNATLRAGDQSGNIAGLSLPNGTFAVDNIEHKYIAIVNKTTGYIAFYKDGNLVAEANKTVYIPTIPKEFIFGKYIGYINTAQVKNILITSHQFSATDITNYGSGNISAISNKLLWYKCNEADTGAPYTDKALDSSGNGNHGTPVNINGATFFNPQNADAALQGNRPNTLKNYLNSGSFKLNQTDSVLDVDSEFTTPILNDYIKYADIVRDYEDKHFLFANNNKAKIKDVIAFSTARSALTTPTLEQVLYYDAEDSFTATGYDFVADQWVLVWESPDKYELMEVSSVSGNKIAFKAAFTIAFDNPIVIPVFKALLLGNPQWRKTTENDLFDVELDFMLIRNLDFASYTPAETYNSVMVMTDINFYQDKRLGNVLNPEVNITDFGYGALAYYKNYNQSTNIKTFGLKATGRAEVVSMLKFINYLNGMQREIYVPTFQRDFEPLANITDIQTEIQVENKGLTEIADSDGLNRVAMLYLNGDFYYAAITSIVETSATVETVTLTTAFGVAVNIETDDFFICWLFKACLLSDQVDIQYRNKYAYAMLNFRETQT